jgi:hypothetical protein
MADILDPYAIPPTDPDALQVLDPYPGARAGRRVKLAVTWETKAAVRDLAPHLRSLTYTDNLSGAADDLAMELEDREGRWAGEWKPVFGDTVVARLEYTDPWFGQKISSLRLGKFAHDKISLGFPPHLVNLQCVSAPLATSLRRRKRSRKWTNKTLEQIATEIAQDALMKLDFSGKDEPPYKQALQHDKSDLEFLEELTKEVGRTLKVTEDTIAIYDEFKLDSGDSVGEIDIIGGRLLSASFDVDDNERYGSCHVTCHDPRSGKPVEAVFPPKGTKIPGLDDNGQTLELVIGVSSIAEAKKRAESLLRNANRFGTTGKLTVVGDPGLVAGVVFDLTHAADLSGKFIITKATHHCVGGYTVDLEVRRCLEGY